MNVPLETRIRGCLLGGAIGDALGAPVEFMSAAEIRRTFGPGGIGDYSEAYGRRGAITDDTQMTLFTAEGLLPGFVREAIADDRAAFPTWELHSRGQPQDRWLTSSSAAASAASASRPAGARCARSGPHEARASAPRDRPSWPRGGRS